MAEIADAQHGVISLDQLQLLGLTTSAVRNRVATGKLHRVYRGAYSVGHSRVSWQGRYMAGVLACGAGAVLSHRPAARLIGLRRGAGRLDVTVPGRRVRVKGIDVHQTRWLDPRDVIEEQRIPCTSVARTIFDLADEDGDERATQRDIDRAEELRIFDLTEIQRVLALGQRRRGARVVATVLAQATQPAITKNELEERMFAICENAGLPRPRVNFPIVLRDGIHVEADFAWPELKLIVETDGWETHRTRRAFTSDRQRDRKLAVEGWVVHRFTWYEIAYEPEKVAAELAALVAVAS
jgi:predicted transcriptional regulator of viral defense system